MAKLGENTRIKRPQKNKRKMEFPKIANLQLKTNSPKSYTATEQKPQFQVLLKIRTEKKLKRRTPDIILFPFLLQYL